MRYRMVVVVVAGLVMAGCGQTRKEKVAAKLDKKVTKQR